MDNQERIFYQDSVIQVTNSRMMIGSQTYPIRNISYVAMGIIEPKRLWANILIGWGALCLIASVLFGGIILIGIGVALYFVQHPKYTVQIQSNSGSTDVYRSDDKGHIEDIVNALNEAIVNRG